MTTAGDAAVIYTPVEGMIKLDVRALPQPPVVCWFDPRAGDWTDVCALPDESGALETPGDGDWILCVKRGDVEG
jgi:hypothetical protein